MSASHLRDVGGRGAAPTRTHAGIDHATEQDNSKEQKIDPAMFRKRSFLRLPVAVDRERLLAEFNAIPEAAWGVSHWDVHCSIDVLLLRGGTKSTAEDFITAEVANSPVLGQCPYIASLLMPEGPFGGARYAFIFRTKPNGITRVHTDNEEAWHRTVRIHLPIVTNPGAVLLAEGRSKHLEVGEAWTFDNQAQHSVANGDRTRVHMIIDVDPNPKLGRLMQQAVFDPGLPDPERWALTGGPAGGGRVPPLLSAKGEPLTIAEKRERGLDPEGFATLIKSIGRKSALLRLPLEPGDVLIAVDGVTASPLSRTALDHIRLRHEPGQTVRLELLRRGRRLTVRVRLRPVDYFSPRARLGKLLRRLGLGPATRKAA